MRRLLPLALVLLLPTAAHAVTIRARWTNATSIDALNPVVRYELRECTVNPCPMADPTAPAWPPIAVRAPGECRPLNPGIPAAANYDCEAYVLRPDPAPSVKWSYFVAAFAQDGQSGVSNVIQVPFPGAPPNPPNLVELSFGMVPPPSTTSTTTTSTTTTSSSTTTTITTSTTTTRASTSSTATPSTSTTTTTTAAPNVCTSPIPDVPGASFTVTIGLGSTTNGSCNAGSASGERAFRWVPATTGTYTISTCDTVGTTFDTVLYVRAPGCQSVQVACNDDTTGCGTKTDVTNPHRGSRVTVNAIGGQSYVLFVDGYSQNGFGAGTAHVQITGP